MAAAENHVMADAAAPPVISRTSAKLAGARSVATSTPSANFALRTSTGAEWQHNNRGPGPGLGNCCVRLCSRGTRRPARALDSHLTPSTKSVRDVITDTDTAHTRNRKPDERQSTCEA